MSSAIRAAIGFRQDARDWGIPRHLATAAFWLPPAGSFALVLLFGAYRPLYDFLLREDSVVEWLTAAAFVAAAATTAVLAVRLRRRGLRRQAVVYGILALLVLVAAGEEISWGQRLFDIETPEAVREANLQEELTVHNFEGVYPLYLVGVALFGLYGSLGSWLVYRTFRDRSTLNARLFVPPLFLSSAFFLLALYRIGRLVGPPVRFGEWTELCVAAAVAGFAALNARRLGSEAAAVPPHPRRHPPAPPAVEA